MVGNAMLFDTIRIFSIGLLCILYNSIKFLLVIMLNIIILLLSIFILHRRFTSPHIPVIRWFLKASSIMAAYVKAYAMNYVELVNRMHEAIRVDKSIHELILAVVYTCGGRFLSKEIIISDVAVRFFIDENSLPIQHRTELCINIQRKIAHTVQAVIKKS